MGDGNNDTHQSQCTQREKEKRAQRIKQKLYAEMFVEEIAEYFELRDNCRRPVGYVRKDWAELQSKPDSMHVHSIESDYLISSLYVV